VGVKKPPVQIVEIIRGRRKNGVTLLLYVDCFGLFFKGRNMKSWEEHICHQEARRRVEQCKSSNYKDAVDAAMDSRVRYVINLLGRVATSTSWVLSGEIALGVWARPRYTDQIEVLVHDKEEFHHDLIKHGFRKSADGDLIHQETGVLIITHQLSHQEAFLTAKEQVNRIRVLVIPWLIFSLLPYVTRKDSIGLRAKADILQLMELYPNTRLDDLPLTQNEQDQLADLIQECHP